MIPRTTCEGPSRKTVNQPLATRVEATAVATTVLGERLAGYLRGYTILDSDSLYNHGAGQGQIFLQLFYYKMQSFLA
jgi:hypothetical protein